jgi:hypothetical protein
MKMQAITLHDMLMDIFTTLFEPQLGLWIGNNCNPVKRRNTIRNNIKFDFRRSRIQAAKAIVARLRVTLGDHPKKFLDRHKVQKPGCLNIQLDEENKLEKAL